MNLSLYTKAALVADALCLGTHWIYNQGKIARLFPQGITEFSAPESEYHAGKGAGELTHYGTQALWLAESLAGHGGFELVRWRADWLAGMQDFSGFLDKASKGTWETQAISASDSDDLAGASRLGAILDWEADLEEQVSAARSQAGLTHGDLGVADAAEFVVRLCVALEEAKQGSLLELMKQAAEAGSYASLDVFACVEKAQAAVEAGTEFLAAGQEMGLTCHLGEAFPLTLYFALRAEILGQSWLEALSDNALCGGDNSARGMLLAVILLARERGRSSSDATDAVERLAAGLVLEQKAKIEFQAGANLVNIEAPTGRLSAVLEWPEVELKAVALFAHCFTCGKDFLPGARISRVLAEHGIATLRIDFAGLGGSEGEFEQTSFLTNLEDLLEASNWLRETVQAPRLLIGHSLGGAAVLAAAAQLEAVEAVVTIGAPADPAHVTHLFAPHVEQIEREGQAEVDLAGRKFVIGKRFLEDLKTHEHAAELASLRGVHTLILHSPEDQTVALENAGLIYSALKHPKSFVSLPGADHLLTKQADARYVAELIEVWAQRALG